jgi:hypothetical protein
MRGIPASSRSAIFHKVELSSVARAWLDRHPELIARAAETIQKVPALITWDETPSLVPPSLAGLLCRRKMTARLTFSSRVFWYRLAPRRGLRSVGDHDRRGSVTQPYLGENRCLNRSSGVSGEFVVVCVSSLRAAGT